MSDSNQFILGEFTRAIDDRFRVSIPQELIEPFAGEAELTSDKVDCTLVKERPGCISLWQRETWQAKHEASLDLVKSKIRAGRLQGQDRSLQSFGRLLSTRHREVQLGGRGRLLVPEGFREFLSVEPGGEVMIVGAAICIEIWNTKNWVEHLNQNMPTFDDLLDQLAG